MFIPMVTKARGRMDGMGGGGGHTFLAPKGVFCTNCM